MANSIEIEISANFVDNASSQLERLDGLIDRLDGRSININGAASAVQSSAAVTNAVGTGGVVTPTIMTSIGSQMLSSTISTVGKKFDSIFSLDPIIAGLKTAGGVIGSAIQTAGTMVGAAAVAGEVSAITNGAAFQAEMSHVRALSGATDEEMRHLQTAALNEARTTKFNPVQTAEALSYMGMAGWKTPQMESGLPAILDLAAAGGADLATTSDIVTDAITAFRQTAEQAGHFANVMATTASNSNTNVPLMGETFKYGAPVAGMMGYSVDDVALATGLMASSEIKGSMAGTAIRTGIANLTSPSKKMKEVIDKYGLSVANADGSMKSFKEVIDEVRTAFQGAAGNPEDETSDLFKLFGKYGASGWASIVNASQEDYDKLWSGITTADQGEGAAKNMAKTMLDNVLGDWTLLTSSWDFFQERLFEAQSPFIREVLQGAKGFIDTLPDKLDLVSDIMTGDTLGMDRDTRWRFQNAGSPEDFLGRAKFAFDEIIGRPVSQWWESGGRESVTGAAQGAGEFAGTFVSDVVNALAGSGEIKTAAGEIVQSFIDGFSENIKNADFGALAWSITNGIAKILNDTLGPNLTGLMLANGTIKGLTGNGLGGWAGKAIEMFMLRRMLSGGGAGGLGGGPISADTVNITAGTVNVYGPVNRMPEMQGAFQAAPQTSTYAGFSSTSAFAFMPAAIGLSGMLTPSFDLSGGQETIDLPMPNFNLNASDLELNVEPNREQIKVPVAVEGTDPAVLEVSVPVKASEAENETTVPQVTESPGATETSNSPSGEMSASSATASTNSQNHWSEMSPSQRRESLSELGITDPAEQERYEGVLNGWQDMSPREKSELFVDMGIINGSDREKYERALERQPEGLSGGYSYNNILSQLSSSLMKGVSWGLSLSSGSMGMPIMGNLFGGLGGLFGGTTASADEYTDEELATLRGENLTYDSDIGTSIMNSISQSLSPENMSFEGLDIGNSIMTAIASSVSPENMSFEGLDIGTSIMSAISQSLSPENMSFEGLDMGQSIMSAIATSVSPENMSFEGLDIGTSIMSAISQSMSPENMAFDGLDIGTSIMNAISQSLSVENMSFEGLDIGSSIMSAISASMDNVDFGSIDIGPRIAEGLSASMEGVDLSGMIEPIMTSLQELNGIECNPQINATDNATPIIESVQSLADTYGSTNAEATLSAADNASGTIASVSSALAALDGKTATVTINVQQNGSIPSGNFATGTSSAPGGLAVINDQRGIADPTELVEHNGVLMEFSGRDTVVPLSRGDKVYTAQQRRAMLGRLPHYAGGLNNQVDQINTQVGRSSSATASIGNINLTFTVDGASGDVVDEIIKNADVIGRVVAKTISDNLEAIDTNTPSRRSA